MQVASPLAQQHVLVRVDQFSCGVIFEHEGGRASHFSDWADCRFSVFACDIKPYTF